MSVLTLSYSPVLPPPPMATTPNQERLLDTGVFAETTSGTCLYSTDHLLAACRNCPPGSQNEKECKRAREVCVRPRQGHQGGAGLGWKSAENLLAHPLKTFENCPKGMRAVPPPCGWPIKFMYIRPLWIVLEPVVLGMCSLAPPRQFHFVKYPKEMTKCSQAFVWQGKNWKQPKFPTIGGIGYDSFKGWNRMLSYHSKTKKFHDKLLSE